MTDHDGGRRGAGDRPTPGERRLAQPPSARYARPAPATPSATAAGAAHSALPGPLGRALLVGLAGAIVLTIVGAILTSTAGLLFAAGVTGACVGLVLARAAAPTGEAVLEGAVALSRRRVASWSIAVSLGAVVVAAIATWLIGRSEGGVLGPIEYLAETFGPFVPGEALVAALGAWWGASNGPVQR
jgi:hypothetical protein